MHRRLLAAPLACAALSVVALTGSAAAAANQPHQRRAVASPASAPAPATTTYLALGDSISFGFKQEVYNLHYPNESPSYFEEGLANFFVKDLARSSELGKSIKLVNDACPGEISNGLIGENPELGGEVSTETMEEVKGQPRERFPAGGYQGLGDWHPCKVFFTEHIPLHNGGYFKNGKEVSQLEEAISTVKNASSPVKAITLDIGLNDEAATIVRCEDEHLSEGAAAIVACADTEDSTVVKQHIIKNINNIISQIDNAGYTGPIVLLGFYNPDAFQLPGSDEFLKAANTAMETEVVPNFSNVTYANPFPVFNNRGRKNSSAKEQASLCTFTELCNPNVTGGSKDVGDVHPSVKGYKMLAKLINKAYLANPAR